MQKTPYLSTHILIILVTALHIVVAKQVNLGVDEAHYALYGEYVALSYYDHPPLIGWLQALVLFISDSDLALRTIPILSYIILNYLVFYISMFFFQQETRWIGFISVAILNTAAILHWLGISLTPDSIFMLLTLLIVFLMFQISKDNRWFDWILLGVSFGLAALTKYTAVILLFSALWYMLWAREFHWLKQVRTWLAVVIALVLITPILVCNYHHDWISFRFQLQHGFEEDGWSLKAFLRMQIIQIGVYLPIIYVSGIAAIIWAWRKHSDNTAVRLLICFSLPILVFFSIAAATGGRSLPHWTAAGWVVLVPLMAFWLVHHWKSNITRIFIVSVGIFSLVIVACAHVMLVKTPLKILPVLRYAVVDLEGWQEAAEFADLLRDNIGADDLYVTNWSHASRIAWYARPTPVHVAQDRFTQYSLWYDEPSEKKTGVIVIPAAKRNKEDVKPIYENRWGFKECALVDILTVFRDTVALNEFYFYQCEA